MASTPTPRNRFNQQGHGDNVETWGVVLNDQTIALIDESQDGLTAITVSGNVTLSALNYAADQSRRRVLRFSGTGGSAIVPGVEKWYIVHNTAAGTVTVKTAAGAGAAVPPGQVSFVYCDATDCYGATYTGSSNFTTKIIGPIANTAGASFNAPPGSSPTAPVNGDIWTTTVGGLHYRTGGITYSPGVELIVSGDATSAVTIDLSLLGDFRAYEILLNTLSVSNIGQTIALRVSIDGGTSYVSGATSYLYVADVLDSSSVRQVGGGYSAFIPLGFNLSTTFNGALIHIMIDRPHIGGAFKPIRAESSYYSGNSGDVMVMRSAAGELIGSPADITDVRIYMSTGTLSSRYALLGRR